MDKEDGVTLIELAVVIAIIGILVVALGFEFTGWMGKYRAESEVKQMYTDFMNARARAMERNRVHFVTFSSPTSYSTYEDTNPAPDGNGSLEVASDTLLPSFPKTVQYAVTGGATVTFDTKGLISPDGTTLCVYSTFDPDYDCIVMSATRMNTGKITNQNGACNAANCVIK